MNVRNLFVLFFCLPAQLTLAQTTTPRKHTNFDEGWRSAFGNAAYPVKDFNYSLATIFSKSGGAAGLQQLHHLITAPGEPYSCQMTGPLSFHFGNPSTHGTIL